jgi:hypothetical protein
MSDNTNPIDSDEEKYEQFLAKTERAEALRRKQAKRSLFIMKLKVFGVVGYSLVLLVAGTVFDFSSKISNAFLSLTAGSVVSVMGTCRTANGGTITLNRDQVTIIKHTDKELNSIINESGLSVKCPMTEVHLESVSITAVLKKELKLQSMANKEISYDPASQIINKAVVITGECKEGNKKRILSNKLMDVTSADTTFITGILSAENVEIQCSKNSRYKIVAESDYDKVLKNEKETLKPKTKESLVGKFARVSGTCIIEDYKQNSKKPLIELLDKVVKVTKETASGITGVTNQNKVTMTVLCDREIMGNVFYEEALNINETQDNPETKQQGE